jgi:Flp pilus assembly protein CpaB
MFRLLLSICVAAAVLGCAPPQQPATTTSSVVIATKAMPAGTIIAEDSIRLVPWPMPAPLPNAFDKIEDVVGRQLATAVVENEPLTAKTAIQPTR